jgi:predicted MFS family arabinose efflux permease
MPAPNISRLTPYFAGACGCTIANLYLAQPLVGTIGPSLSMTPSAVGLSVTATQVGYGLGLILLVPLGDLTENRRLILRTLCGASSALLLAATAPNALIFLAAALLVGLGASATQMLIPIAAHLASDAERGRIVGSIMSGLLVGVLLSRPVSSLLADAFGWRAVFGVWAALMLAVAVMVRGVLPQRKPDQHQSYRALLGSLWTLLCSEPVLRRRAAYQAVAYGVFSLFWTAVPLRLAHAPFYFDQRGIALFTLAGAAGALIAPVAGRAGDRGWTRPASGLALSIATLSFVVAAVGSDSPALLVAAAVLLDLGVWSSQVLGQRAIYALAPGARSRLNGLFISIFFIGGASGSALAGVSFDYGGWSEVCWIGAGCGAAAVAFWLTEFLDLTAFGAADQRSNPSVEQQRHG